MNATIFTSYAPMSSSVSVGSFIRTMIKRYDEKYYKNNTLVNDILAFANSLLGKFNEDIIYQFFSMLAYSSVMGSKTIHNNDFFLLLVLCTTNKDGYSIIDKKSLDNIFSGLHFSATGFKFQLAPEIHLRLEDTYLEEFCSDIDNFVRDNFQGHSLGLAIKQFLVLGRQSVLHEIDVARFSSSFMLTRNLKFSSLCQYLQLNMRGWGTNHQTHSFHNGYTIADFVGRKTPYSAIIPADYFTTNNGNYGKDYNIVITDYKCLPDISDESSIFVFVDTDRHHNEVKKHYEGKKAFTVSISGNTLADFSNLDNRYIFKMSALSCSHPLVHLGFVAHANTHPDFVVYNSSVPEIVQYEGMSNEELVRGFMETHPEIFNIWQV